MTNMYDACDVGIEALTARRGVSMHRDQRRCVACLPDGSCWFLTWAIGVVFGSGRPMPGATVAILTQGTH